jgi:PBP1b-binding outer membrane lipoprotein LpoB
VNARPVRLPRALAASALALALPLAGCAGTAPSDDEPRSTGSSSSAPARSSTPEAAVDTAAPADAGQRIEVRVTGGQVSGDTGRVPVAVGEQVTLVITSDVADEAHLHGYDLTADLASGTPAEIAFVATIPGVFEVELHDAGTVLLSLQVS